MSCARPWGRYEVIQQDSSENFLLKKIVVNPSSRLSLQSHEHRSEHWIVTQGKGLVVVGEDEVVCALNTHVFIPRGAKHRMQNTSKTEDLVFVEVQVGNILLEEDIVRYEDDYSRIAAPQKKVVCVSGYFDPVHKGHIEYLKKAKFLGDKLLVIVNNDQQCTLKKGKHFMPAEERCEIMRSIAGVDEVVLSIDTDRTVCETLKLTTPDLFVNGGDQNNDCAEAEVCKTNGIELVDGLGTKIQSSSWLTGIKALS